MTPFEEMGMVAVRHDLSFRALLLRMWLILWHGPTWCSVRFHRGRWRVITPEGVYRYQTTVEIGYAMATRLIQDSLDRAHMAAAADELAADVALQEKQERLPAPPVDPDWAAKRRERESNPDVGA